MRAAADVLVTDIKLPEWLTAGRSPNGAGSTIPNFSPVTPRPVAGSLLLQKPFHPDEIVRAVRQMTEGPQE
jgi:hypothetical protein